MAVVVSTDGVPCCYLADILAFHDHILNFVVLGSAACPVIIAVESAP
eukprot:COSAG02_NODE_23108_length_730_cov_0.877971_2_plen_47_part_00